MRQNKELYTAKQRVIYSKTKELYTAKQRVIYGKRKAKQQVI